MFFRFLAALVLLSLVSSHCQTLGANSPQLVGVGSQHFVCNTGYSAAQCNRQMAVLRPLLSRYQADRLGEWTWVLVRSEDWKELKQRLQLDPDSPAFSYLPQRRTFLEEALVSPVPGRSAELIRQWGRGLDDLLLLAITHELGHALCSENDERKADLYGRRLRAGEGGICQK